MQQYAFHITLFLHKTDCHCCLIVSAFFQLVRHPNTNRITKVEVARFDQLAHALHLVFAFNNSGCAGCCVASTPGYSEPFGSVMCLFSLSTGGDILCGWMIQMKALMMKYAHMEYPAVPKSVQSNRHLIGAWDHNVSLSLHQLCNNSDLQHPCLSTNNYYNKNKHCSKVGVRPHPHITSNFLFP